MCNGHTNNEEGGGWVNQEMVSHSGLKQGTGETCSRELGGRAKKVEDVWLGKEKW